MWTVKAQKGSKNLQQRTFVGFHNSSYLLTMVWRRTLLLLYLGFIHTCIHMKIEFIFIIKVLQLFVLVWKENLKPKVAEITFQLRKNVKSNLFNTDEVYR